jgi:hypothetical protein
MKYNNIKTKKGKAKPNPTKKGFEEDRATSIVRHVTKPCLLTIQHWLKLNKSPNSSVGRALGCFPNGPGFESLFGRRDLFPAEKEREVSLSSTCFLPELIFSDRKKPVFFLSEKTRRIQKCLPRFLSIFKKNTHNSILLGMLVAATLPWATAGGHCIVHAGPCNSLVHAGPASASPQCGHTRDRLFLLLFIIALCRKSE